MGSNIGRHQQFALGIDGRPHSVAGPLQALDGFVYADLAMFDLAEHRVQLVERM
jgi:hypothetical protein